MRQGRQDGSNRISEQFVRKHAEAVDGGGFDPENDGAEGDGSAAVAAGEVELDTVKPAPGQSAVYKYRGIYLLHDADYGQWSPVVETTVMG